MIVTMKHNKLLQPRTLFLIFMYSMAFSLLILGLKLSDLETRAARQHTSTHSVTSVYESPEEIQQNIAKNIIRLHVIANSNSDNDQSLKLKVRDGIIEDVKSCVHDASNVDEARKSILSHKSAIEASARKIIRNNGYNYDVNVSLKDRYFPVKSYGDLIFPAGTYDALCVEIGTASGRNWWCVLFPSLCLVDDTRAVVPDDSKEKLKETLTDTEYYSLENKVNEYKTGTKPEIECHSALYDWLHDRK